MGNINNWSIIQSILPFVSTIQSQLILNHALRVMYHKARNHYVGFPACQFSICQTQLGKGVANQCQVTYSDSVIHHAFIINEWKLPTDRGLCVGDNCLKHAINESLFQMSDEKEGPVTKSIRLTSALILRNLVIYSSIGKMWVIPKDHILLPFD